MFSRERLGNLTLGRSPSIMDYIAHPSKMAAGGQSNSISLVSPKHRETII